MMMFNNPKREQETIETLTRWLENRINGVAISEYFSECGYQSVGIIDAGEIGKMLYQELKKSTIEVRWFIDKNAEGIVDIDGIPVKLIKQVNTLDEVDIVCISPVYDYEMVTRFLVELKPEIRTIALCDVVSEIWS